MFAKWYINRSYLRNAGLVCSCGRCCGSGGYLGLLWLEFITRASHNQPISTEVQCGVSPSVTTADESLFVYSPPTRLLPALGIIYIREVTNHIWQGDSFVDDFSFGPSTFFCVCTVWSVCLVLEEDHRHRSCAGCYGEPAPVGPASVGQSWACASKLNLNPGRTAPKADYSRNAVRYMLHMIHIFVTLRLLERLIAL